MMHLINDQWNGFHIVYKTNENMIYVYDDDGNLLDQCENKDEE